MTKIVTPTASNLKSADNQTEIHKSKQVKKYTLPLKVSDIIE